MNKNIFAITMLFATVNLYGKTVNTELADKSVVIETLTWT